MASVCHGVHSRVVRRADLRMAVLALFRHESQSSTDHCSDLDDARPERFSAFVEKG